MNTNKDTLIKQTKDAFFEKFNQIPEIICISPGRINIIGEHVDYNNGLAMPVAIDRYLCVAMSRNHNRRINAFSTDLKDMFSSDLDNISETKLWHKYVQGSILEALGNKKCDSGINLLINSDIPMGKGLSSSAALELSILSATLKIFSIKLSDNEIIDRCQRVDHKYIGIKSGKLDQSACLLSKENSVFIIDFNNSSIEYIPIKLKAASWVLIDSMIKRELASSKYHERVEECQEAFKKLSTEISGLSNFRDINEEMLFKIDALPINLKKRVKHIISENQRVLKMKDAITSNNVRDIGYLLRESHGSLKKDYEVSCKEIDYLLKSSEKLSYWHGGRIMGGGFGGSTLNLIKKGYEKEYIEVISDLYKKKFGIICEPHLISFVNGVETIDNISAN